LPGKPHSEPHMSSTQRRALWSMVGSPGSGMNVARPTGRTQLPPRLPWTKCPEAATLQITKSAGSPPSRRAASLLLYRSTARRNELPDSPGSAGLANQLRGGSQWSDSLCVVAEASLTPQLPSCRQLRPWAQQDRSANAEARRARQPHLGRRRPRGCWRCTRPATCETQPGWPGPFRTAWKRRR
jgi:hypothetical protein